MRNSRSDRDGSPCGIRNTGEKDASPHAAIHIPHSKGFTLLEVMVAVAILGMVLVSLLGLKNRSVQDVMVAERITTATLLAKRVMTETLLSKNRLPLEEDGEFEEQEFKDFRWTKVISPTPLLTIVEVRVAVLWQEGDRQEMVELVSYE